MRIAASLAVVAAVGALGACSGDDDGAPATPPPASELVSEQTSLAAVDSPSGGRTAVYYRAQGGGAAGWVAHDIWVGEPAAWTDGTNAHTPHVNPRRWGFLCDVRFRWESDDRLTVTYGVVGSYLDADGLTRPMLPATSAEIAGTSMTYEFDPAGC